MFYKRNLCFKNRCFTVNFAKFLRTPFFTEHLRWLLLILFGRKELFNYPINKNRKPKTKKENKKTCFFLRNITHVR